MKIRNTSSKGFSLIESMVTLAIMSVVILMFYQLLDGTMYMSMYLESHNDLVSFGERAVNQIQAEVHQAKKLFQGDADGNLYQAALQLDAAFPVWQPGDQLMPMFDTGTSDLEPDPGISTGGPTRRVGNCLLLVKHLAPIEVPIDGDGDGTPDKTMVADHYIFYYYYLFQNSARHFRGNAYYVDLAEARSIEVADYFQLSNLSATTPAANPTRQQMVDALFDSGISTAWDPNQTFNNSFHAMSNGGGLNATPISGFVIPIAKTRSMLKEFIGGRISGKMDYSVGFRPTPATQFPVKDQIPKFGIQNVSFPGGLEVMVVGPVGNRIAMARLVLISHYKASEMDSHENVVLTSTHF